MLGGAAYSSPDYLTDTVVIVTASTALGDISCELSISVTEVLPVEMSATVTEGEMSFREGDFFTFGGKGKVSVLVRYNNGVSETIAASDDIFFSAMEPLAAGQTEVEITLGEYKAVKATVPITVIPLEATEVVILTVPKTNYAVGETVSLDGLILLVTMDNGSVEPIPYNADGGFGCTPTVVAADTTRVTVTYAGFEVYFDIEVA